MNKFQIWIEAARLRTLPLSLSGILMGSAIAFLKGFVDWKIFTFAILSTLLFQILSNFANDFGDGVKGTDNESRIGPQRAVQSGEITPQQMKKAVVLLTVLSLISAGILIYFGTQKMPNSVLIAYCILALFCVLAAITYTVGKKAYGYHGLGDLMVFIFFGFVSVLGVFSLYSKQFDWMNVLPAVSVGLLSVAVLNLNNMRDYYSDKQAGKNTLVVIMGLNRAKMYHLIVVVLAIFAQFIFVFNQFNQAIYYLSLLPFIVLLFHLNKIAKTQNVQDFDPELKKIALLSFAVSCLFFTISCVV